MMKEVIGMQTTRIVEGPGMYAYDAEALVRDVDTGERVYVFMNWYEGVETAIVSTASMFDSPVYQLSDIEDFYTTEPIDHEKDVPAARDKVLEGERLESYVGRDEVVESGSAYLEVFGTLEKMIEMMRDWTPKQT